MTEMKTFDQAAAARSFETATLVSRKQRDYGPKNILNCPVGVELGLAVRLYDKLARLVNLVQSGTTPENESLMDTAKDIQGYGLILEMYLRGEFELPLEAGDGLE